LIFGETKGEKDVFVRFLNLMVSVGGLRRIATTPQELVSIALQKIKESSLLSTPGRQLRFRGYAPSAALPATPISLSLTNNKNTTTITKHSQHVLPMS
jgi:hypothetical protein